MNRNVHRSLRTVAWVCAAAACLVARPEHSQGQVVPTVQGVAGVQTIPRQVTMAEGPRGMVSLLIAGGTSGSQITLPVTRGGTPGYSRRSGFQLGVDTSWPGSYGYRPVLFTLTRQKPAVADQQITVQFSVGDWVPPREEAMNVDQRFTFPAGATTATHRVLVPRYQDWQTGGWKVLVDGRSDDFLAVKRMHLGMFNPTQIGLGVLGVGLTPQQESDCNILLQTVASGTNVGLRSITAAELPTDWREYAALDLFILPAAKIETLARQQPQGLDALLRWVRSGGNLWLIQSGNRWQNVEAVERALGVKAAAEEDSDTTIADDAMVERGWRFPTVGERSIEASQGALLLSGFDTGRPTRAPNIVGAVLERFSNSGRAQHLVVRGHGLGVVAAFREGLGGDPNGVPQQAHDAVSQSLLGPRLTWAPRHGNQPDTSNQDFNNLLIPGVGVAPVGQFQFLVTLFAIAIGPLNYWLLKRKNKLPMLLATVPIAALATTAVLFAYGTFADGFSVRARSRTLTLLDQKAGEAVSWGRLSYYAGITPRSGLKTPGDQLMYPIMPRWLSSRYGGRVATAPRYLEWQSDQWLKRGWLASRTPTQYQAITCRPSSRRLDMRVTDAGLRIDNRLGADVTHLAVEDHDGRFYWCENLAAGKRMVVRATDQNKLASGIRQLFTANIPESPAGDENDYGVVYGHSLSQNIMEGRLEAINDPAIRSWGRGKYIAFTKHAIELDLGLDTANEEASFHVIEGTW